jgi:hypothetical protein
MKVEMVSHRGQSFQKARTVGEELCRHQQTLNCHNPYGPPRKFRIRQDLTGREWLVAVSTFLAFKIVIEFLFHQVQFPVLRPPNNTCLA